MVNTDGYAASAPTRPVILTSFVGRESELQELRSPGLENERLLTLVGPGGIGKTRLALHLADSALGDHSTDLVFVDLGSLAHESLVDAAVLEAAAPGAGSSHTPLRTAIAQLRDRSALVVLDTCEHLPSAASRVADALVDECPDVRIVATSRIPLRASRERTWRVPPLSVAPGSIDARSEAARLFVERVSLVRGDMVFTPHMWAEVERIVRALDGFPLAIELAAARVRMMTLGEIAAGLDLRLLAGGPARGQSRHQTMRRSLDWSHALLSEREKLLFARLSVFVEGWTADAAAAVCADDELTAPQVLESLTALVDKSLVAATRTPSGDRFRMPLPLRQYAAGHLAADAARSDRAGSDDKAPATRHLAYYVQLAERSDAELWPFRPDARVLIDVEVPNLRAALDEACRLGSVDALRITAAMGSYWRTRGSLIEGVESTGRALEAAPRSAHPARAMTLAVRSTLTFWVGDLPTTQVAAVEALEMAKEIGDARAHSHALLRLANFTGIADPPLGRPMLREAVELARSAGDTPALADALGSLTLCLMWQDEFALMADTAEETLAIAERIGFTSVLALTHWCQAHHARVTGEMGEAARLAGSMIPMHDKPPTAGSLGEVGSFTRSCAVQVLSLVAAMRGEPYRARGLALTETSRSAQDPMRWGSALLLQALGFAELAAGNLRTARVSAERLYAQERDGSRYLAWQAQTTLMLTALASGDPAAARRHAAEIVRNAEHLGNRHARTVAELGRARASLLELDAGSAEIGALAVLAGSVDEGWWLDALTALEIVAAAAVEREEHARGARLFAAVDAARSTRGIVRVPTEATYWDGRRTTAADGLDDLEHARAVTEGAAMSVQEAAEYARNTQRRRSRAGRGWASLTPTESRVALLAADGLLNPEIAEQLFVSRSTVKVHLSHIFAKLGVTNRTELAVYVHSRRPTT